MRCHAQTEGGVHGVRGRSAPAFVCVLIAALTLAACQVVSSNLDPQGVNGRDGGGPTPTYPMLMRIGDAARSGGDLPNALGVYRRAAEMAPADPAPLIAAGDVLLQMGNVNEAIVSYNAALVRPGDTHGAQVGLTKAFLMTGKPQLALSPLSQALAETPDDPKLLLLLGVTKDFSGQQWEAQDIYRRALSLAPGNPALTVNFALSLTLSGDYANAIAVLQPLAAAPTASPQDRQTLALIYGLRGNIAEAARLSQIDLDAAAVEQNLAYFQTLRELSPEARARALLSSGQSSGTAGAS
jgi:Flp pilus assembly protein TadD